MHLAGRVGRIALHIARHIPHQYSSLPYIPQATAAVIITRELSKMAGSGEVVWSFGYGSNMDVVSLQAKKHVKIVDHVCAVLKGWRMSFNLPGMDKVEPSYANVTEGGAGDEVHGVAFCMTKESGEELDRTEVGYDKKQVKLEAYDGRVISAFLYVNKPHKVSAEEIPPSARYLGVLVKGAKAAGLNEAYIQKLSEHKVYEPSEETLAMRKALPDPESLRPYTVEELAQHGVDSKDGWVAVDGYVIPYRTSFNSHLGRDITTRMVNQYYAVPLDDNDDRGRPPYPILDQLDPDVKEYVLRWRDYYVGKGQGKVSGAFLNSSRTH